MPRSVWIALALVCSPLLAQDPPTAEPAEKPTPGVVEATKAKPSPLEALRAADEAGRSAALAAFVDAQIATGAVFSGQYADLAGLEWDATPLLRGWLTKPPVGTKADSVAFRVASVQALRDCVKEPPAELLTELEALATGVATPTRVATSAKYALAQFGKTEHVDKMIEAAKADLESTDVNKRVSAWTQLADVYYNMRRYEDAAKAHRQVIQAIEGVNPSFTGLPSTYYNAACSAALAGNKEQALELLGKGLELGVKLKRPLAAELVNSDMDIRSLREEPAFAELMKKYFGGGDAPAPKPAAPEKKD
jgi:tetratricopeptide (TPR) repeat protein